MTGCHPPRVFIHEVSTRDGFQIEPIFVPTQRKVDLINNLGRTGLAKIEVTSFTSPKAIPALADAEAVMQQIRRESGVVYATLVPNLRGAERAIACQVDELNVVISVSETHNLANLHMTTAQSLNQVAEICRLARGCADVQVSVSTTFGCPFEGGISEASVLTMLDRLVDIGIERVSLCDTTGMANPAQVQRLCAAVKVRFPQLVLTLHLHNTRSMGLANAFAALQVGVDRFDASLGGLGGCPFAPGASGNVCTEDLVHMFEAMGCNTGVDLDVLIGLAQELPALVGHDVPGQVFKAGPSTRRYPPPDSIQSHRPQQSLAKASFGEQAPAAVVDGVGDRL